MTDEDRAHRARVLLAEFHGRDWSEPDRRPSDLVWRTMCGLYMSDSTKARRWADLKEDDCPECYVRVKEATYNSFIPRIPTR